jgi:hypothetical protein
MVTYGSTNTKRARLNINELPRTTYNGLRAISESLSFVIFFISPFLLCRRSPGPGGFPGIKLARLVGLSEKQYQIRA